MFDWQSYVPVIGVDEVGRGCLAGPVCAAAVLFQGQEDSEIVHYTDSKLLSSEIRKRLSLHIHQSYKVSLAWASVKEIDELNILQASLLAMKRAVLDLKTSPEERKILVDGRFEIKGLKGYLQTTLIQGDRKAKPISAASIVAKVFRDEHLAKLSLKHPEYGLHRNKGYGTREHRKALVKWGPTCEHRKSFKGVKEH